MSIKLLPPNIRFRYTDSDGEPLALGKVWTSVSGGSTPAATFSDEAGVGTNTNPVLLNGQGEADIYLTPGSAYRFVVMDAADVVQRSTDGVYGAGSYVIDTDGTLAANSDGILATQKAVKTYIDQFSDQLDSTEILREVFTATQGQTVFTLVNPYVLGLHLLEVDVNGANQLIGVDFTETSTTSVTMTTGLNAGDVVVFTLWNVTIGAVTSAGLVSYTSTGTGAVPRDVNLKLRDTVSVKDYGADPTGVLDSTAAFNLATQAAAVFSTALQYNITIPSGVYKIDGTVYVRAGQTLWGDGHGTEIDCRAAPAATPTFVLGSGSGGSDASGSPIKIGNFWTLGGSATAGVIRVGQAGFEISSVFMTGPGIGIEIVGSGDGLISDMEIDQCLTGVNISAGSQNITFTNFNIYLPNYAIIIGDSCRDITFSTGVIEYTKYASVYFADAAANIKAITFTGIQFVLNAQYGTFVGFVYSRATNVEAAFANCSFRNMLNHAINQDTGTGTKFTFTGCIFDGTRSTTAYDQSTTAKVLNTGVGTYSFNDCEFRNLLGEIATLNNGLVKLIINGGLVSGCDANATSQKRLNVVTTERVPVSVRGVSGFGYKTSDATNQLLVLPYWGGCGAWRVSVQGNPNSSADTLYGRQEESIFSVSFAFNGTDKRMYADKVMLWETPTRTIPGDLASVVCFGTASGGAATGAANTHTPTGSICIAVPAVAADASAFEWFAETAL